MLKEKDSIVKTHQKELKLSQDQIHKLNSCISTLKEEITQVKAQEKLIRSDATKAEEKLRLRKAELADKISKIEQMDNELDQFKSDLR